MTFYILHFYICKLDNVFINPFFLWGLFAGPPNGVFFLGFTILGTFHLQLTNLTHTVQLQSQVLTFCFSHSFPII